MLPQEQQQQQQQQQSQTRAKSKINPFMPSSIKPRMSFERRRWAHIFPLRSDGTPIYAHINWTTVRTNNNNNNNGELGGTSSSADNVNLVSPPLPPQQPPHFATSRTSGSSNILSINTNVSLYANDKVSPPIHQQPHQHQQHQQVSASSTQSQSGGGGAKKLGRQYSGGANSNKYKFNVIINKENWDTLNNESESMATMKTGVAWKSLTMPACLPLTTDFFPNKNAWNKNFACSSNYSLLLDDIREQYGYNNFEYSSKITMAQVFTELVGHRLALGFQMVVPKDTFNTSASKITLFLGSFNLKERKKGTFNGTPPAKKKSKNFASLECQI